jgi:hypothetical protein
MAMSLVVVVVVVAVRLRDRAEEGDGVAEEAPSYSRHIDVIYRRSGKRNVDKVRETWTR